MDVQFFTKLILSIFKDPVESVFMMKHLII